ncbi:MAG: efflux RND transporter periplasmic adaptor subunit [Pirellulales bacterium]|nr:efflux RND transporter periplasmic adaptor subunit [Pirellulales bacterium]
MSSTRHNPGIESDWQQLEEVVESLHLEARARGSEVDFYRKLLSCCVTTLAASGGAIWRPTRRGPLELCYQINLDAQLDREDAESESAHQQLLQRALASVEPQVVLPGSGTGAASFSSTADVIMLGAVYGSGASEVAAQPRAVIELFMRSGCSPAAQQGWQELLATVCHVAADFYVFDELRTLQSQRGLHDQSLLLLRRIHRSTDLRQTAIEIANEGRRFLDVDRLSVVMRRGKNWRLQAASGVDRIEPRSDTTKQLEILAGRIASWGEPLEFQDVAAATKDLPNELARVVEQYMDHSHGRALVAVPVTFAVEHATFSKHSQTNFEEIDDRSPQLQQPTLVLVAEQFGKHDRDMTRQRVVELAALCEPAWRQAVWLNRFPLRTTLRGADAVARWFQAWGLSRATLMVIAFAVCLAALGWVDRDFEVEAPAKLVSVLECDVFATADGTVREIRTRHGAEVHEGDVLAVLDDPQLALEFEQVDGEIATVSKRLEAIAVARTQRTAREDLSTQALPLSAEAVQLQKKRASLIKQQEILDQRRAALSLRSPITGQVLTLDLQNRLQARPVQRGQVLFTVADTSRGWLLEADVSQDDIGHILAAQRGEDRQLPVRFRLAGGVDQIFSGHLEALRATAVLATDDLGSDPPSIQAKISVDEEHLGAARPGMSAQVRIGCGKRSFGYIWLHDAWETVYSWWAF